jgi:transposase
MFNFFGGVPRLIVPDNLKSGVNYASFYDPEINRSYGMMASHYGVGVLPGRLRRQAFFSLAEANAAIAQALDRINAHVMGHLGVSRRHLFETVVFPVSTVWMV